MWRVLARKGLCETMKVTLRQRHDPILRRTRVGYRHGVESEKWERHLTSGRRVMVVLIPQSEFTL